jgi:hypothetical protein
MGQPGWGDSEIMELQARPVELWLHSLHLAPRGKSSNGNAGGPEELEADYAVPSR